MKEGQSQMKKLKDEIQYYKRFNSVIEKIDEFDVPVNRIKVILVKDYRGL